MNINDRVLYALSKIRNIIYYRLEVEERLFEERYRCQYLHVLRKLRKDLIILINDLGKCPERDFFCSIINVISSKIKPTECKEAVVKMKELYDKFQH